MSRLTVTLDDELLRDAAKALGTTTKRGTIVAALEEARRTRAIQALLSMRDSVESGLTQEELSNLRHRA